MHDNTKLAALMIDRPFESRFTLKLPTRQAGGVWPNLIEYNITHRLLIAKNAAFIAKLRAWEDQLRVKLYKMGCINLSYYFYKYFFGLAGKNNAKLFAV